MLARPKLEGWLMIAMLAASGTAAAQTETPAIEGASDESSDLARTYFNEGLEYADDGDWERAVQRFRAALELRDVANIRFNLAQSLARMGRIVEALAELGNVLADPEVGEEVRVAGEALRASLGDRLGTLIVQVRGERAGAQVTIDGRPLREEELGAPVATDPGVRIARLLRGNSELDVEEVDVPAGRSARVSLEVPTIIPRAALVAPVEQRWDDAWTWTIVLGAVLVVAGTAVGIGFALTDQVGTTSMGDFGPPVLEID